MPYFSWWNAGALAFSAVISTALMIVALGAGPRRLINVSFSLYAGVEAAWALASIFTDLQLWLGRGDPSLSLHNSMLFLTLMAPLLLLFAVRSLGVRNRAADAAAVIGLAAVAALGVPLYRGEVVTPLGLGPSGTALVEVHPLGMAAAALVAVLVAWAFLLLLRARRAPAQPFMIVGVVMLFGGLVDGIFSPPFPLLTITNTASVALIGYAVTRRQVFNPLRETAAALATRVDELERAREAMRERARRLELLARLGRETTSILDPEELMRRTVRLVGDTFAFYNVSLLLVEGGEIVLRAASRDEQSDLLGTFRLAVGSRGITAWVAATGTPRLAGDVARDPQYVAGDPRVLTKSELAVPVVLAGRVVGVLDAQSIAVDAFSEVDVFTLQTVADQLAVAMENARLYAAARRELAERAAVEDRLGIIAEQSPNMIFLNVGGRVVYANRRCEEITGWRREEMLAPGFDFRALIAPESLPTIGAMFARHLRGEEVPPYEYSVLARDGRRISAIITTRLVTYGGERGILGMITDITERKRTERLLQGLNAAALALQASSAPRDLLPALGGALRGLGLSTAVVSTAGDAPVVEYAAPSPEILDAAAAALCREAAAAGETRFAPTGPVATIVAPLARDDEAPALLLVRGPGLADGDRPAVTAFAQQVAAVWHTSRLLEELETSLATQRRIQAQFVQSQKMEAIGRLAGGVAHDFNNLLTAIGGYADLLRMTIAEPAEERSWAEQIAAAAAKGAALTRKLLAFSRKQVVEPRLLDLREVVHGVEGILRRIIGEHIELATRLPDAAALVMADLTQLEQAVLNLAVNAGDAMPSGGRLTIGVADASGAPGGTGSADRDLPPGDFVVISVADTGVGMDAEVQSHLFEPFFTTKERGKGTGLGLSTVYGAVQTAGGHLRVTSAPGRGSEFRIYLPRAGGVAAVPVPSPESTSLPRGTETVLVVEDEPAVRDLVCRLLRGQGYTVLAAEQGSDALALCRDRPGAVDLVVTDIVMPGGMSGRDLAEHIGRLRPAPRVLLISGYEGDPRSAAAQDAAATPLLKKPFTAQELAHRVRQLLDAPRDPASTAG